MLIAWEGLDPSEARGRGRVDGGGAPTPDKVINSHLLYQLSYSGSASARSRRTDNESNHVAREIQGEKGLDASKASGRGVELRGRGANPRQSD